MMRALVTGATGFLGRHMCARLRSMGWHVTGMGRDVNVGRELELQGVQFVQADLRDEQAVIDACAQQDVVFHCGALSSPWGAYRDFQDINVAGTRHVVAGCLEHHVKRFIHISTPSIYFDYDQDRLQVREQDPLPPKSVNAYAATKLEAEQVVLQAFECGLPALILRPRAIFGPYDRALLPRLMRANDGKGVPLINGGTAIVDLTYVDNVVDAMLLGWEAPESALGQAYNITNGEPIMLREVLEQLFTMIDVPLHTREIPFRLAYGAAAMLEWSHRLLPVLGEPPLTRYSINVLSKSQTLDLSQAREQLGYHPRISLKDGLQHFAQWWSTQSAER